MFDIESSFPTNNRVHALRAFYCPMNDTWTWSSNYEYKFKNEKQFKSNIKFKKQDTAWSIKTGYCWIELYHKIEMVQDKKRKLKIKQRERSQKDLQAKNLCLLEWNLLQYYRYQVNKICCKKVIQPENLPGVFWRRQVSLPEGSRAAERRKRS